MNSIRILWVIVFLCFANNKSFTQETTFIYYPNVLNGPSYDWISSIAVSQVNPQYRFLAGNAGECDIDPSTESLYLENWGGFVCKVASSGSLAWCFQLENTTLDDIQTDQEDNVYIVGEFYDQVDFDPSSAVVTRNTDGHDLFIAKYDSEGNFIWVIKLTASDLSSITKIVNIRIWNNLLMVGGNFRETLVLSGTGSSNQPTLESNGNSDIFFAQYNLDGELQQSITIGEFYEEKLLDFEIHITNIIASINYENYTDIDPWSEQGEISTLTSTSFIAEYDLLNDELLPETVWFNQYPTYCWINDIQLHPNGLSFYAAGGFTGILDFDPSIIENVGTSNGAQDGFIVEYSIFQGQFLNLWTLGGIGDDRISFFRTYEIDGQIRSYIAGTIEELVDVQFGEGSSNLFGINDLGDLFCCEYDQNMQLNWSKTIGLNGFATIYDMEIFQPFDPQTFVALNICGSYWGSANWSPNSVSPYITTSTDQINDGFDYWLMPFVTNSIDAYSEEFIRIYPNPVKDILFIDLKGINSSNRATVEIVNDLGCVVHRSQISEFENQICTSNLECGAYMLKLLIGDDYHHVMRFVKG